MTSAPGPAFHSPAAFSPQAGFCPRTAHLIRAAFLVIGLGMGAASLSAGELADVRLRVAWGGGAGRQWEAILRAPGGTFSETQALGMEADVPGSLILMRDEIRVGERGPRTYDGMEVRLLAPRDARLSLELVPRDEPAAAYRAEVEVGELLRGNTLNEPLDDRRNRVLMHRAPGDDIRVGLPRESLVLTCGEEFSLSIQPHELEVPETNTLVCTLQLVRHTTEQEVWRDEFEFRRGAEGRWEGPTQAALVMPDTEGVYDLKISLAPRRFPNPLLGATVTAQRHVQLVVLKSAPLSSEGGAWRDELEIDLANPNVWDRLKRLTQLTWIPRVGQEPLSNQRTRPREHGGQKLTQLDPGGWQAVPLPISRPGLAHVLEVEYPEDVPQTLGISLIEPNAVGQVHQASLDSGVNVPDSIVSTPAQAGRHRLLFWPRTRSPFVLLTNRRPGTPAVFGKLRVLQGPQVLPPATDRPATPAAADKFAAHPGLPPDMPGGRSLALYLDKPLFPENFGAAEGLDAASKLALDDWQTFYEGGTRLTQYARHFGYDRVVLSVARDGSALYPSPLLEPTLLYDKGLFFQNAQDPLRKDVLELLFRLFDREGLQLLPAVHFSSPLPALERQLRADPAAGSGILLIGDDGRSWADRHGPARGGGCYYNPLDRRVQAAMRDVLLELVARYGHHSSFAGVAIQLGPQSFSLMPGVEWGLDDTTMARFATENKLNLPQQGPSRFAARGAFVQQQGREAWLSWRARVLADFYGGLEAEVAQRRPGGALVLTTGELYTDRVSRTLLRPTLPARPQLAELSLRMGLQPALYRGETGLSLPRPTRVVPLLSLGEPGLAWELERSSELDELFRSNTGSSVLHLHEALPLALPSFDEASPFGPQNTRLRLNTQLSPSGLHNRRRFVHSLAEQDPECIMDGGAMIPLGQEDALRDLIRIYRQLPARPMASVPPAAPDAPPRSVVVRRVTESGRTYFYLAQDAPWPVTVHLQLQNAAAAPPVSLGIRPAPPLERAARGESLTLQLEPFDLQGFVCDAPDVQVLDWTVKPSDTVVEELEQLVQEVQARVGRLRKPEPLTVLSHPGFEAGAAAEPLPGWEFSRGPGIDVTLDRQVFREGTQSLKVSVTLPDRVAWVRSKPFPPPSTGRVSVMVWLRTRDKEKQPPLRLAIEGLLENRSYYRYAPLGRLEPGNPAATSQKLPPLQEEWGKDPFLFHVDDLPLSGLTTLQVGFDLMGPGEVWIDDVQVFDTYFQTHERNELLKLLAATEFNLQSGNVAECARFLDGYWPRFLLTQLPGAAPSRVAERPALAAPLPVPPETEPPRNDSNPGWRRYFPRSPLRLPFQRKNGELR